MRQSFEQALSQSTASLKEHVDNEYDYSGVKFYRESVGVGPIQLNNIEAPNVIRKIWDVYKTLPEYSGTAHTIESFLGIAQNSIYPREMHLHEKVLTSYNVLNIVGYNPDSKMQKERRFIAAMSDASHASMASFCDFVFSNDLAFIKKLKAVYECLEVKTQVIEIKIEKV